MNRYAYLLLLCTLLLFSLGLLMVFDTTAAEVLDRYLDRSTYYALIKQLLYALFGALGAVGIWFVGYQNVLKWSGSYLVGGTILLALVFVPGIGQEINGAKRWLGILGNSFQPSEFVKYLIPLYFIHAVSEKVSWKRFYLLMVKLALPMGLILIEPDNGTVAIILVAITALCFLMRIRWLYWALPLSILVVGGAAAASQMPHVSDRLSVYLHPEMDIRGKGHQTYQAKIAAGSGGLLGKGIGESLQKLDYLPEARSDFIAAIFAEEFGFLGIFCLLLLYMMIGYLGFFLASRVQDGQAMHLIAIVTFLICFQAFLNLGIVSGLLPNKGTNLPFFSQGGSSLVVHFMMLSLLLNAAMKARREETC